MCSRRTIRSNERSTRTAFAGAGHVVWEAEDGAQALELVRSRSPELLLVDIWMPIFNGLEVLERLKTTPEAVGLKVVVLSNHHDADTRLEGSALGVVDYWTKDLSVIDLCGRVEEIMRPVRTPASDRESRRSSIPSNPVAFMVSGDGILPGVIRLPLHET